ncbi:hypothetical protein ABE137_12665 [Brevibacillus laterosporus]|uniref:hypothetical protein n=1 Tax=Brevibacillus laterosporus TaxID=1465 RepID=UPI0006BD9538|nr:putative structural protein [Brevibacillus phage Sundance]ALA47841.1 putative structural protein [Brevibacillus phage Sundance]
MATPLTEIYDSFLSKVTDYSFLKLNEEGVLEEVLFKHLRASIVRFTNCTKELLVDEASQSFTLDLDPFEIEMLATLMTLSYVSGKILNVKNTEQILSDKDYKIYSTANFLSQLIALKQELQSESSHLMNAYSLKIGLEELK